MKPWKEEKIKSTREAIEFASTRAAIIKTFCRAMFDTSQSGGETDRETINRMIELISILEDEVDYLQEELDIAFDVDLREQKAREATA